MSGDRDLQKKAFEDAIVGAAAKIKSILSVVTDAEYLTQAEVNHGFSHLEKALTLIRHQALNENAIAQTANFSLSEAVAVPEPPEPAAPIRFKPIKTPEAIAKPAVEEVDDDVTLDLAPELEVVGRMGKATLVHKEGHATLRLVGELPPETGNAAPITDSDLALLQE